MVKCYQNGQMCSVLQVIGSKVTVFLFLPQSNTTLLCVWRCYFIDVKCYRLQSCLPNDTQEHKTYIYNQPVTLDIDYAQCYNIQHSDSVLLCFFNVTGTVTFDQSVQNECCQKLLFYCAMEPTAWVILRSSVANIYGSDNDNCQRI